MAKKNLIKKDLGTLKLIFNGNTLNIFEGDTYVFCWCRGESPSYFKQIPETAKVYDQLMETISEVWA